MPRGWLAARLKVSTVRESFARDIQVHEAARRHESAWSSVIYLSRAVKGVSAPVFSHANLTALKMTSKNADRTDGLAWCAVDQTDRVE